MSEVLVHRDTLGVESLCGALGLSRATFYRRQKPKAEMSPRPSPPRALSSDERSTVLAVLHEPRFVDQTPLEVYATLLDEERYLCSPRTMYRILDADAEVRERRAQLRHANHPVPQLLAERPNQVWSWDITKLLGPATWTYFYLYVIMDIFSRYVVGWMVGHRESAALAKRLISETLTRQGIAKDQLTIHADRGTSMRSKLVAQLLADLGVTKTHSRPHVSNDNPYSEAGFKTLKYRPDYPAKFGSLEDARAFHTDFFDWYNNEHHHSGLALMTPHDVHDGLADARRVQRATVLDAAFLIHPERFPRGRPTPLALPTAVWINPPASVPEAPSHIELTGRSITTPVQ